MYYHDRRRARQIAAALAAVALLAAAPHHHHGRRHHGHAPSRAAAAAIAYAEHPLGKPYCWGGTGPDCFDCSGLVMQAWAAAGVTIPRTSQEQWSGLRHVARPQPGDLVEFAGADGTTTSPGHVGLVIGRGRMVEAYATGFPIRVASYRGRGAVGFVAP